MRFAIVEVVLECKVPTQNNFSRLWMRGQLLQDFISEWIKILWLLHRHCQARPGFHICRAEPPDYSIANNGRTPMAVDQQEILQAAEKLGQLLAQHPAVEKYKQAQKAVADDPEASRLLADFDKQIETLGRQE